MGANCTTSTEGNVLLGCTLLNHCYSMHPLTVIVYRGEEVEGREEEGEGERERERIVTFYY